MPYFPPGSSVMVGDSGSGGVAGSVPAPAAGDALKFLRGNATWGRVTSSPLQVLTASNSASLNFTGADNTIYRGYRCVIHRLLPATDGANAYLRASSDQGATLRSGAEYDYTGVYSTSAGYSGGGGNLSGTGIVLFGSLDNASRGISGWVEIIMGTSAFDWQVTASVGGIASTGPAVTNYTTYGESNQASLNGFGFVMSSGNIASGTVYVYGILLA